MYFFFYWLYKGCKEAYIFQQLEPIILLWLLQIREKHFFFHLYFLLLHPVLTFKQMLKGKSRKESVLWQPGYQQRNNQLTKHQFEHNI